AAALADLAVLSDPIAARGSSEMGMAGDAGVPLADINVDGARYFDIHHTVEDTLRKIDPEALRPDVAAHAVAAALAAASGGGFLAADGGGASRKYRLTNPPPHRPSGRGARRNPARGQNAPGGSARSA